jgi:hypothetical protein
MALPLVRLAGEPARPSGDRNGRSRFFTGLTFRFVLRGAVDTFLSQLAGLVRNLIRTNVLVAFDGRLGGRSGGQTW